MEKMHFFSICLHRQTVPKRPELIMNLGFSHDPNQEKMLEKQKTITFIDIVNSLITDVQSCITTIDCI